MDVGGWKWSYEAGGGEGCMTRLAVIKGPLVALSGKFESPRTRHWTREHVLLHIRVDWKCFSLIGIHSFTSNSPNRIT